MCYFSTTKSTTALLIQSPAKLYLWSPVSLSVKLMPLLLAPSAATSSTKWKSSEERVYERVCLYKHFFDPAEQEQGFPDGTEHEEGDYCKKVKGMSNSAVN